MKISEIFYSIQGEGIQMGRPMVFVRLSGCNLRCSWCDTKYAYEEGKEMTIGEVIAEIKKYPARWVLFTGGEPMLQIEEIHELMSRMKRDKDLKHYWFALQTNGTLGKWYNFNCFDWVSMDMKPPSSGVESVLDLISELPIDKAEVKVVIQTSKDLAYAYKIVAPKCLFKVPLILQPEGGIELKELIEAVKTVYWYDVRVLPQLHKIVYPEQRKEI